jgi:hypothetical protein
VARLLLLVVISTLRSNGEIFTILPDNKPRTSVKACAVSISQPAAGRNDIQNESCFYENAVAKK